MNHPPQVPCQISGKERGKKSHLEVLLINHTGSLSYQAGATLHRWDSFISSSADDKETRRPVFFTEGPQLRAWTLINHNSMKAHGWLLNTLKSGSLPSTETPLNYFYAVIKFLLQEKEEQEGNVELNQYAQHPNRHDLLCYHCRSGPSLCNAWSCSQGLHCWRDLGAARQQTGIPSSLLSPLLTPCCKHKCIFCTRIV